MDKAMDALKELMDKTDKVRIVGPGTDLTFSIKGIGTVKCSGERSTRRRNFCSDTKTQ